MTVLVPLKGVVGAQHLRCIVRKPVKSPNGSTALADTVMDVYTGWLTFDLSDGDLVRDHVRALVPLGTGSAGMLDIQEYAGGISSVVVTASLSSFAGDPDVAAVDSATVKLKTHNFPGVPPADVLVLDVNVAVQDGTVHRVSYQITVLAAAKEPVRAVDELEASVIPLDRSTTSN